MPDFFNPIFVLESGKYVRFFRKRLWLLVVWGLYFAAMLSFGFYNRYVIDDPAIRYVIDFSGYVLMFLAALPLAVSPAWLLPRKYVEQDLILHTPLDDFRVILGYAYGGAVGTAVVCLIGVALLLPFHVAVETPIPVMTLLSDASTIFCWIQICSGVSFAVFSGIREPFQYTLTSVLLFLVVTPLLILFLVGSAGLFMFLHSILGWSVPAIHGAVFAYSAACLATCTGVALYFVKTNTFKSTYYPEKIAYTMIAFMLAFYAVYFVSFVCFSILGLLLFFLFAP